MLTRSPWRGALGDPLFGLRYLLHCFDDLACHSCCPRRRYIFLAGAIVFWSIVALLTPFLIVRHRRLADSTGFYHCDEMPCYSLLLLMLGVVDRRVTAAHAHTCPALPAYSAWHAHPYNSAIAAASSRITPMLTPFNLQLNSILKIHPLGCFPYVCIGKPYFCNVSHPHSM